MPSTVRPDLSQLERAITTSAPFLARVDAVRDGTVGAEGGDVGAHGSSRLVTRHVANYLAAVDIARRHPVAGAVVDVGSGVGALGAWAARELESSLCLVDRAANARAVSSRAFPEALVASTPGDVPEGTARLLTAMEVIEHIEPAEQPVFLRQLANLLAPGGVMVVSTPDEGGYLGGWSGYAPHVGTLSYSEFTALLARNTPWPVTVWRLEGEPFELGRVRAVAEPVVNRAWGLLDRRAPAVTARAAAVGAWAGRLRRGGPDPEVPTVRASEQVDGVGTGLLGVVQRPGA